MSDPDTWDVGNGVERTRPGHAWPRLKRFNTIVDATLFRPRRRVNVRKIVP
jgi:hypothetical protein